MNQPASSPLTDSPWFWVLAFSLMGLMALVVIGNKYSRRQANIERNYQARERVAERVTAEAQAANNSGAAPRIEDSEAQRAYATPGNRLIPVWPLAVLLTLVSLAAAGMLYRSRRGRGRLGSLGNRTFFVTLFCLVPTLHVGTRCDGLWEASPTPMTLSDGAQLGLREASHKRTHAKRGYEMTRDDLC